MAKWLLRSVFLLVVLVLLGSSIAIYFVFSPARLTPMVEKTAAEYLNAQIRFGGIELTFFSTFPDVGVRITNATVVSGVFQDTAVVSVPEARDSLMNIRS